MPAFYDARCKKCDKKFGWTGQLIDRPPCPRCGDKGPPLSELKKTQEEMDAMEKAILERVDDSRAKAGLPPRKQKELSDELKTDEMIRKARIPGWISPPEPSE